jgi:hypothetical protein
LSIALSGARTVMLYNDDETENLAIIES